MFNPNCYENSRPDGIGVLEVVDGAAAGEPRRFVPLKRTELHGEVAGPLAALRLTQVFGFAEAECDKVLEAAYRFPLPGDAAVTGVRVRFGDVAIRAALAARAEAEADYGEAKRQGRQAALATRESPDVFTLQVAGLQPGQDVTVETTYVQLARPEGAGWSLRIPLTTAPRYVRGDEATSRPAQGQPLALLRDPGHRFALDLAIRGAGSVESPTHALDLARDGDRRRVRLREGEVLPDRDCVLSWRPEQEPDHPALHVLLHDDAASGFVYFLALVAPPATGDRGRGVPREVVLLVDHSGSMNGAKWAAADWAVERFLSDLTDRDAFALGLFHNSTRWFSRQARAADPRAVGEAIAFLKAHHDSGGTELGVALEQALSLGRAGGEPARHVLIVTDAEVSDAGRILRLADQESQRPDRRRVSVLCIDAAPNSYLAQELAGRGGGVARFLTSAPEEGDIATALDEVLADWAEPVLAGLRLEVDRPGVRAAGRPVTEDSPAGRSAVDLGDLPAGRPIWVAGRFPRGSGGPLAFRLATGRGHEIAARRLEPAGETPEGPAIKALFGARLVLGLEHLIHSGTSGADLSDGLRRLGYDPDAALSGPPAPPKVYAENTRSDAEAALKRLLVRESLGYGLASSETAFLAVRTEAGRQVEGRVAVANALPAGWSGDFVSLGPAGMVACLSMAPPRSSSASLTRKVLGAFGVVTRRPRATAPPPPVEFDAMVDADMDTESAPAPAYAPAAPPAPRRGAFPGGPADPRSTAGASAVLFAGVPTFSGGEAVLFDTSQDASAGTLPAQATFGRLALRFPDKSAPRSLDPGLSLLIYVDDLASPRARVRLVDLARQGGERPLNLARRAGQVVRVVLIDPAGSWTTGAPRIEVELGW